MFGFSWIIHFLQVKINLTFFKYFFHFLLFRPKWAATDLSFFKIIFNFSEIIFDFSWKYCIFLSKLAKSTSKCAKIGRNMPFFTQIRPKSLVFHSFSATKLQILAFSLRMSGEKWDLSILGQKSPLYTFIKTWLVFYVCTQPGFLLLGLRILPKS